MCAIKVELDDPSILELGSKKNAEMFWGRSASAASY
jgi:hypothetical protein